jgi:hypothetical protein
VNMRIACTVTLLAAAIGGATVAQQPEVAVQDSAAVENRFIDIAVGDVITGYLTAEDDTLMDGSHFKLYFLTGVAGDSITISLASVDFNTDLLLADSTDVVLDSDDNAGGSCNSHLNFVLPDSGRYNIYATSTYGQRVGEYQLSVTKGIQPPNSTRRCGGFFETKGTVSVGDSVAGTLGPPDDSKLGQSYYQVWGLSVPAGHTVTVDLISDDFDARLRLYRGFAAALAADDDGGGKCNARIVLTSEGHPYRLVMDTGKADETGKYVLKVTEGELPVTQKSECS